MERFLFGKKILILCLGVFVIGGCVGAISTTPATGVDSEQILMRMSQRIRPDERVVATASIDAVTAQGRYPVKAALVLQKPSYLRIELLPVIGTPELYLAATPAEMKIFVPSRGEFYMGKPTLSNIAHFLPWTLNIEDFVMIFTGAFPPVSGKKLSYQGYTEALGSRVSVQASAGESQTVWLDKGGHIVKLIRCDADGKEMYQAVYEEDDPTGRIAGRITLTMADHITSLTVKFTDVKIEPSTDLSVYELSAPAGVKIIKLD